MIDFNKTSKGKILDDLFMKQRDTAKDEQATEKFHSILERLFENNQISHEDYLTFVEYGMYAYESFLEFLNSCENVKLVL